jgi:hypothetical protein
MPIFYLVAAALGLPVVLYGLRIDRGDRPAPVQNWPRVRATGAFLLFGGLTGFALSLLSLQPVVVAVLAVLAGAGGGWLRHEILRLQDGEPAPRAPEAVIEGGTAVVVVEVTDTTMGQVVVEHGSDRTYLAAVPFRRGTYPEGEQVVVVAVRDEVALVAGVGEVSR